MRYKRLAKGVAIVGGLGVLASFAAFVWQLQHVDKAPASALVETTCGESVGFTARTAASPPFVEARRTRFILAMDPACTDSTRGIYVIRVWYVNADSTVITVTEQEATP